MKITLSPDLERAMLRAIAEGVVSPDVVSSDELSKRAKIIHSSIVHLFSKRAKPPLRPTSIMLMASSLFGVDKNDVKEYLKSFADLETGNEIGAILRSARDKTLLVSLINEAGSQLKTGELKPKDIIRLLNKGDYGAETIRPISDDVTDKFPKPPSGIKLRSLPIISEAANGIIGIWIIGGEPGLGKSTLALQLALDVSQGIPAIYYDLDGTGREWTRERLRNIAGDSVKTYRKLTSQFYFRETIASLDEDISFLRREYGEHKPALLVVDSIQTLPASIKYHKESMDSWIARFKGMTQQGLIFVCVSEQNRAHYGEATMGGYKGSGDIEYAGSLCVQLLQDEGDDSEDPVKFVIVKNRHGKKKGHIVNLKRDTKKVFWFTEEGPDE